MATSTHPSHHEWGTEEVAAPQRQRLTSMATTPPLTVAVETTLASDHQLLNNPPLPHTSPSVMEQWRHNID
jgi:hypothetical protein